MIAMIPTFFNITPMTSNITPSYSYKKCWFSRIKTFTLNRIKGFHNWQIIILRINNHRYASIWIKFEELFFFLISGLKIYNMNIVRNI